MIPEAPKFVLPDGRNLQTIRKTAQQRKTYENGRNGVWQKGNCSVGNKTNICTAVLAHVDAGKTTLSEALLYVSGNIRKAGRVDNGDAFLDTYALERERGITIFSKQAVLKTGDETITLLDTPGHVDFSAEMERTLGVLDYAILVVSGADGVQSHTRTLWRLLEHYNVPVFLFVNKMDQPGAVRETLLAGLKRELHENCVDFSETDTEEFFENVAVCEEGALEQFLKTGEIAREKIRQLISERQLFPCFFGSALKLAGVKEFLDGFLCYTKRPAYPAEFGAKVFKIARDEQGNRLTYLKVTGGSLRVKQSLQGVRQKAESGDGGSWEEKVNQIRIYSGEKYETADEVFAGGVCAVTGLSETYPGEGFGTEEASFVPMLAPVLTYQILLPEGVNPAVMLPKLRCLEEEEPQLHIIWNEALKEIQVQLMGEVQIEILKSLIKERFGVEVEFGSGNIVYKETIANTVEGVGHFEPLRHYAEVHLLLEPGERGSGLVFAADCSEDILDRNWQRLVLTHLKETEHIGVLTGSAITDMKITLINGRAHLKHTEGGDFRQATYRALRQGLMCAESVLLEPYYDFVLELPEGSVGRALNDIERMHGTVDYHADSYGDGGTADKESAGSAGAGLRRIAGSAPVATMQNYQREVVTYTKGAGRLTVSLKGYFPCHNTEEVVERIAYDPLHDTEHPTDSVFCAHGAGFLVPWNQVEDYMHLPYRILNEEAKEAWQPDKRMPEASNFHGREPGEEVWIGTEEIDRILAQTYNANKRDKASPGANGWKKKRGADGATAAPVRRSYQQKAPAPEYLLVDGYNIIFAWEELSELARDNIDGARGRLLDILCNYQGIRGCELIVVFDAYRVAGHQTEILDYHNIHVVYTKEAETADAYIEKFAHENGTKYRVTVATSDGLEQIIIRGAGCGLISARELEQEVQERSRQLLQEYDSRKEQGKSYLAEKLPGQPSDAHER